MDSYSVHIQGLSCTTHRFQYDFGDAFFSRYGAGLLSKGLFHAEVTLDKRETFIEATFQMKGTVKLICDRSLDEFDHPMNIDRKIIFKFGNENKEISEDVLMIHRHTDTLHLGQYMFEFIGLAVPMKRLHPRYQAEDEPEGIIFTSGEQKEETDPRWEALRKLK